MCSKNVGRVDAYLRISTGLMLVSLGIMKKKGWLTAIGSMKVAEGVTRYCPVMALCHCTTMSDEEILEDALCMGASTFDDEYLDDICGCGHDCACEDDCECGCEYDVDFEEDDDLEDYEALEDVEDYQEEQ